jgi:predicted nucleotidyltransferase
VNDIGFNKRDVTDKIIGIISAEMRTPHYRVFYFGSRVAGKGTERSDLDADGIADRDQRENR